MFNDISVFKRTVEYLAGLDFTFTFYLTPDHVLIILEIYRLHFFLV